MCASTDKALPIAMRTRVPPRAALGPKVMAAIGEELRGMYAEIIAEGVPERFAEILRSLDQPTREREIR